MKNILIVDDAVTVRMYHRQLMESSGFQVEEAENGIEALEKGLSRRFDLLIVDVNMPKMDGYRFVEEIRKSPEMQSAPVIMVSTEAGEKDRQKAFAAGANYYVVKPAKDEELQTLACLMTGGA